MANSRVFPPRFAPPLKAFSASIKANRASKDKKPEAVLPLVAVKKPEAARRPEELLRKLLVARRPGRTRKPDKVKKANPSVKTS